MIVRLTMGALASPPVRGAAAAPLSTIRAGMDEGSLDTWSPLSILKVIGSSASGLSIPAVPFVGPERAENFVVAPPL